LTNNTTALPTSLAMARAAQFPNDKSDAQWSAELTSEEFHMLRNRGTEAPGKGEFFNFFPKQGYFGCRACKHPLYSSTSKFKDCGWDAFDKCFFSGGNCHVGVRPDFGGLEIICNACNSHLGHVFYGERHTDTDERH